MSFFKSRQHDNTDVSALPSLWILQIKSKEKKMKSLEHQYHEFCNQNRVLSTWDASNDIHIFPSLCHLFLSLW